MQHIIKFFHDFEALVDDVDAFRQIQVLAPLHVVVLELVELPKNVGRIQDIEMQVHSAAGETNGKSSC